VRAFDIKSIEIVSFPQSPLPVLTAVQQLAAWLQQSSGIAVQPSSALCNDSEHLQIVIGTVSQGPMHELVQHFGLPVTLRYDGYVVALRDNLLLIYSQVPRGTIYACSFELPHHMTVKGSELVVDIETIIEEPADRLRAWCTWATDYSFMSNAVTRYRLNMVWMEAQCSRSVLLPGEPALQPYIAPFVPSIHEINTKTAHDLAVGKSLGLEVFVGSLAGLWQLPDYLYTALYHVYPDATATSYKGGSDWPPYEWQDRPNLCLSSHVTRRLYTAILDEFMAAHPDADGFATGFGYDGYPLGCGCSKCQSYAYADRFHDQIMLVYDVVVKKYHKKLWLWTWVVGGASAIPGYDHYYGWIKSFAEANPESVIVSSFATEGDFNITHPLNPVIGTRGPQDLANVLVWPEYRGDGVVPAWLVDWMATSFPAYRKQGATGFTAVDVHPHLRERDIIQGAELYAFGELTWDGTKTAHQVASDYCRQAFGAQAAPFISAALRKSSEVISKTLYLPCGARFSGHSHIENDLRVMWDVYTLYDSAPFFLTQPQRAQIIQAGPPYASRIEATLPGLAFTTDNIASILRQKDEAVAGAEWMIAQAELAKPYLSATDYEQLRTRFEWLMNYARLFRGVARAFFHLRLGRVNDAAEVMAGAEEMNAAMAVLPQTGLPLPYNIDPQFGGYPWMITPPGELINSLRAAAELLAHNVQGHPIGIFGSEETAAALDSIFLPYARVHNLETDLSHYSAIVIGPSAMQTLDSNSQRLAQWVQSGGRLLIYNPSENWLSMPAGWLPGQVQCWVCNHPSASVTQPQHPIVHGYAELKAEPITRFQATSAQVQAATKYAPFIKSFVAVSSNWKALTQPAVLAETTWGKGHVVIDLIPENRTILLRALAYLTTPD
jgi:hypothetical protein